MRSEAGSPIEKWCSDRSVCAPPVPRGVDLDLAHAVGLRAGRAHAGILPNHRVRVRRLDAGICPTGRLLFMDASLVAKLRAIPIFADLDDEALARVGAVVTEFEAPAGHVLTQPGQEGSGMFILEEGTVTVELPPARSSRSSRGSSSASWRSSLRGSRGPPACRRRRPSAAWRWRAATSPRSWRPSPTSRSRCSRCSPAGSRTSRAPPDPHGDVRRRHRRSGRARRLGGVPSRIAWPERGRLRTVDAGGRSDRSFERRVPRVLHQHVPRGRGARQHRDDGAVPRRSPASTPVSAAPACCSCIPRRRGRRALVGGAPEPAGHRDRVVRARSIRQGVPLVLA